MKLTTVTQLAACCVISLAAMGAGSATQAKKTKPAKIPYSKVEPLLKAKCIACHNPDRHPGGVDVSTYKALMKSGSVVAGHPEKSKLIQYVDGTKQPIMPFKGKPLSKAEITQLKNWIASGAAG